jgi:hypothetical protein
MNTNLTALRKGTILTKGYTEAGYDLREFIILTSNVKKNSYGMAYISIAETLKQISPEPKHSYEYSSEIGTITLEELLKGIGETNPGKQLRPASSVFRDYLKKALDKQESLSDVKTLLQEKRILY